MNSIATENRQLYLNRERELGERLPKGAVAALLCNHFIFTFALYADLVSDWVFYFSVENDSKYQNLDIEHEKKT